MRRRRQLMMLFAATLGLILLVAISLDSTAAQSSSGATKNALAARSITDDLQLSYRLDHYTELADSGPARGENIYAHKCWVCHNKYQKEAPHLEGLFHFDALVTGAEVNDDTVTTQIRNGGPGMPSFHTTLSDADIADVVSYLHSDKCCVEGEILPANPWYRAASHKWSVQRDLSGG